MVGFRRQPTGLILTFLCAHTLSVLAVRVDEGDDEPESERLDASTNLLETKNTLETGSETLLVQAVGKKQQSSEGLGGSQAPAEELKKTLAVETKKLQTELNEVLETDAASETSSSKSQGQAAPPKADGLKHKGLHTSMAQATSGDNGATNAKDEAKGQVSETLTAVKAAVEKIEASAAKVAEAAATAISSQAKKPKDKIPSDAADPRSFDKCWTSQEGETFGCFQGCSCGMLNSCYPKAVNVKVRSNNEVAVNVGVCSLSIGWLICICIAMVVTSVLTFAWILTEVKKWSLQSRGARAGR